MVFGVVQVILDALFIHEFDSKNELSLLIFMSKIPFERDSRWISFTRTHRNRGVVHRCFHTLFHPIDNRIEW